jgi:hypothetical protein
MRHKGINYKSDDHIKKSGHNRTNGSMIHGNDSQRLDILLLALLEKCVAPENKKGNPDSVI